ncbi:MAG: hypothetical protein K9N51_06465 [Candidatus Pacebacteria bacterium]|nr:hypothetical protein [Candidatus Paceibacterota bacterium]
MISSTQRVAVLGVGGGGARTIARVQDNVGGARLDLAVADTDQRTFQALSGMVHIALGPEWDCDTGCGGDVELGERASGASADDLREFIGEARLLLVVAGLGGGTGSGAVKVVARLAREEGVPAFFLVTLPFAFEGHWRRRQAEDVLQPLRELADAVIVVQNDLLFTMLPADTPADEAFTQADAVLASAVNGLAGIAWAEWMLTADFAAIRTTLKQHPATCNVGVGQGTGADRSQQAIEAFLQCPLIGGPETLAQADAAVITLLAGDTMSVGELRGCLSALQGYFPERARVMVGACASTLVGAGIQITGLICRQSTHESSGSASTQGDGRSSVISRSRTGPPPPKPGAVQEELPLQEQSLGIFSGTTPTTVNGENLDIPTYQRRGIHPDAGD